MRGQGDGEAERRGTEPTTSTLNSSPPSQPREATGAAAAEREPRDTRAQQRRHCQSPSLLMLTGHPRRHLECASRHYANPMPRSFPSFFPEWSPLESSGHINSHTTTRLAGYSCTGCALHSTRPCGSGSLAGVQHSSPDPDEEVHPFAVARTRVGTFYLISEETGRRSFGIRGCLPTNQFLKIEFNTQYWSRSNTTGGQIVCLNRHSGNSDVSSSLQKRKPPETGTFLPPRTERVLWAESAREESCRRHKVAPGPRANPRPPISGCPGGQIWDVHGQTTSALGEEACEAQRLTSPRGAQRSRCPSPVGPRPWCWEALLQEGWLITHTLPTPPESLWELGGILGTEVAAVPKCSF